MKGGIDALALGGAIRGRREAQGLSQRTVAERVGLSRTTISRIETGEQVPTLETLDRIAKALDCPPHLFLAEASSGGRSSRRDAMEMLVVDRLLGSLQRSERRLSIAVLRTLVAGLEESRRSGS